MYNIYTWDITSAELWEDLNFWPLLRQSGRTASTKSDCREPSPQSGDGFGERPHLPLCATAGWCELVTTHKLPNLYCRTYFLVPWCLLCPQNPVCVEQQAITPTFMSSSRACGSSMPSGTHFLFSGRDSSFSTRAFKPFSSNSVRWVHLVATSVAGDPVGVLG